MLVDLDESELQNTVANLDNPNVSYCIADVSKTKDVKKYVAETLSAFGKIDIFSTMRELKGKLIQLPNILKKFLIR